MKKYFVALIPIRTLDSTHYEMAEIIPINIAKLDAEFAENEQTIKNLQQRNMLLAQVKQFIYTQREDIARPSLPKPPAELGVSAFVEWYLEQVDEATARQIAEEWAAYIDGDYEVVKTTVSNALNRLKNDVETVDSRAIGVGRKDGYYYFLRNK